MAHLDSHSSVQAGAAPSPFKLCNVIQMCEHDETRTEVSIIAIPGYGTPPADSWHMMGELDQVAALEESISRLFIYSYKLPGYETGHVIPWASVLVAGSILANDLIQLATEAPKRPLIFISHSLGGIVLKKAILEAQQSNQDARSKLFARLISGIIFIGTPHSGKSDNDTFRRYNEVLYSCCGVAVPNEGTKPPCDEVFQLARVAVDFEQIATMPVLSVFEIGCLSSPIPLVDRRLASISSSTERLLGVPLAHKDLCKLSMLGDRKSSAMPFLRLLLEDSAATRWPRINDATAGSRSAPSDLINPLHLLPLVQHGAVLDQQGERREVNISLLTSLPLSLRIRALRSSRAGPLVDSWKMKIPNVEFSRYRNPNFIGREDAFTTLDMLLLATESRYSSEEYRIRVVGLCGRSGIGKTDLATEYAYRRRSRFGAIFWVEASSISQLAIDFGRLAVQLGLHAVDEERSIDSSIEAVMAWLTDVQHGDGWLLIFDNADDLDVVSDFVPSHGNGSVLIISRSSASKTHFVLNGVVIDVVPFSVPDTAFLLRKLVTGPESTEIPDKDNAYAKLAERIGGLPSIISQIAGFIRHKQYSVQEFVELHTTDHRQEEIHDINNPGNQAQHIHAVTACLHELSQNAKKLLRLIAFMNPHHIQEYIFSHVQISEIRGINHLTAEVLSQTYAELAGPSIIRRDIHKKDFSVHRHMQAEVRNSIHKDQRPQAFKDVLTLLLQIWPATEDYAVRWALCEDLLPHLEQCYQLYVNYDMEWTWFEGDPTLPTLLNKAAIYLRERGFAHEGSKYVRLAFSLCARDNITQEPLISDLHLAMGGLSNESNDPQSSLEHNIRCFSIRQAEAAQANLPDLRFAFAHNQIGIALMMAGKICLATSYFKQNIKILDLLGASPDEFGFPVCNLGLAYWIQGRLDEADKTLTELLTHRQELQGTLDMVNYKYKLGRVLHALGNVKASKALRSESDGKHEIATRFWDESFAFHTNCLAQYQSTSQRFNHRTADVCYKLAEHHIRRKEHGFAQYYLHKALGIWGDQKSYQNESARASFLLGTHLQSIGATDTGNKWLQRATLLRRNILPDESPRALDTTDFDDLVCFWSI